MTQIQILAAFFLLFAQIPLLALDLEVEVQNRKSTQSNISCALFEKADGFPTEDQKRFAGTIAEVDNKQRAICRFKGLSAKKYAVAVLEDLNRNGKMDFTFVGLPKEPWGVSNNAPMQTFGPPSFEDSLFQLSTNMSIQVKLNP